ncbi:MAG: SUMF1/EgtB/PvdO family nonheme iron enzyme [Planctomycetes bacterium]|nr:SUMF1/EgtB/PvdO family nonheme iron enzyme [Planctomycetota bacterium]
MNRAPLRLAAVLLPLFHASCKKPDAPVEQLRLAQSLKISTTSGISMMLIPGGEFMMGRDNTNTDESPRHRVIVSPFAIDQFEVTQAQFATLEIPDPSQFKSPDRPVEQIRWLNAAEYCNERSKAEGLEPCYDEVDFECDFEAGGYRLPTEAEWEYAARAGDEPADESGSRPQRLKSYACYAGNSKKKTDPVGHKKPNAWGLHDMIGNVAEWCHDIYSETYYHESPEIAPRGPSEGTKRVMRGGSWKSSAASCRVSARQGCVAGFTDACFTGNTLGFRCVRRLTPDELQRLQKANSGLAAP